MSDKGRLIFKAEKIPELQEIGDRLAALNQQRYEILKEATNIIRKSDYFAFLDGIFGGSFSIQYPGSAANSLQVDRYNNLYIELPKYMLQRVLSDRVEDNSSPKIILPQTVVNQLLSSRLLTDAQKKSMLEQQYGLKLSDEISGNKGIRTITDDETEIPF